MKRVGIHVSLVEWIQIVCVHACVGACVCVRAYVRTLCISENINGRKNVH